MHHSNSDPRQLTLALVPVEETIDVFTAARVAQVSMETIRRWCESGHFPAWKLVGRWRIDRGGFLAWLESLRVRF